MLGALKPVPKAQVDHDVDGPDQVEVTGKTLESALTMTMKTNIKQRNTSLQLYIAAEMTVCEVFLSFFLLQNKNEALHKAIPRLR